MEVSWKRGTPNIIHLSNIFHYKPSILDTSISETPHMDTFWQLRHLLAQDDRQHLHNRSAILVVAVAVAKQKPCSFWESVSLVAEILEVLQDTLFIEKCWADQAPQDEVWIGKTRQSPTEIDGIESSDTRDTGFHDYKFLDAFKHQWHFSGFRRLWGAISQPRCGWLMGGLVCWSQVQVFPRWRCQCGSS